MIAKFPYRFTSDEVLFQVYAKKQDLTESEFEEARKIFYSKGQPCLRTSPLAKSYGFGIHHDEIGRIALFGMETAEYQSFLNDNRIEAFVGVGNIPSLKIMEQFNFVKEGVLREHWPVADGYDDSEVFSKLYSEYINETTTR